jgi:hypothetical protein
MKLLAFRPGSPVHRAKKRGRGLFPCRDEAGKNDRETVKGGTTSNFVGSMEMECHAPIQTVLYLRKDIWVVLAVS